MRPFVRAAGSSAAALRGASFAVASLVALALLSPARGGAQMYYFQDDQGAYHFTNAPRPGAARFVFDQPLDDLSAREPAPSAVQARAGAGAYDDAISEYAERYRMDPELVRAVIRAESGFNRVAVSPKGARGLMQLMPATAREHGCHNPYDADANIHAGVEHLRTLLDAHGENVPRALAAYNAGSKPVARYHGIPPYAETEQYVSRVLRLRREYRRKLLLARREDNRSRRQ